MVLRKNDKAKVLEILYDIIDFSYISLIAHRYFTPSVAKI